MGNIDPLVVHYTICDNPPRERYTADGLARIVGAAEKGEDRLGGDTSSAVRGGVACWGRRTSLQCRHPVAPVISIGARAAVLFMACENRDAGVAHLVPRQRSFLVEF